MIEACNIFMLAANNISLQTSTEKVLKKGRGLLSRGTDWNEG